MYVKVNQTIDIRNTCINNSDVCRDTKCLRNGIDKQTAVRLPPLYSDEMRYHSTGLYLFLSPR